MEVLIHTLVRHVQALHIRLLSPVSASLLPASSQNGSNFRHCNSECRLGMWDDNSLITVFFVASLDAKMMMQFDGNRIYLPVFLTAAQ